MKKPFVTAEQLEDIAVRYPTPFHLYDAQGIRENARRLKAAFSWNPGYREYFAVKATPTPAILKILQEEGCGCDCSSLTELMMAERIGCTGENIMFSSNETPAEDYRLAAKLGATINLDDVTHVDFLEKTIGYIPKRIGCRFNPGGTFSLGESREGFQVMDNPGDAKYGMTRPQLTEALLRLRDLGAVRFGLHAFLSSNTTDPAYYPALARLLFQTGRELMDESGMPLAFVNLSGGIGIPYRPDQPETDIRAVGEGVAREYRRAFTENGIRGVAIKTELGRYMTGPNGWLVTHIINEKRIHKHYLGLDASACDLMRPAMYGAYHHITIPGKEYLPHDQLVDVTGSLCENNDKFAVDRMLPKTEIGDLLVIHDTGAHGLTASCRT